MGLTLAQFDRLDPDEREYRILWWERKRRACHECGRPADECSDPTKVWYPYRTVCRATMAQDAAVWQYDALHEAKPFHDGSHSSWSAERTASHPFTATAGVHIGVNEFDVNPDDKFTTRENAPSVPEQAPGDHHESDAAEDHDH